MTPAPSHRVLPTSLSRRMIHRLRTAGVISAVAGIVFWAGCPRKNHPPDAPSTPLGPASGWTDSVYAFSSSATDPEGDSLALRFAWGDRDTTGWSRQVAAGESVVFRHLWLAGGTYQLRARAMQPDGAVSEWSTEHPIEVLGDVPPNTPPAPAGPSSSCANAPCSFTAATTDPREDSVAFQFDWGYGDTSAWSQLVASGRSVTMTHSWSEPGPYPVRVRAKDKKGAGSDWSEGHTIRVSTEGAAKWAYATGGEIISGPAISSDGTIYFGSDDSCVYALHPDGSLKWRHPAGDRIESSPAIGSDGTIYVGSYSGLLALTPDNVRKWSYGSCGVIYSGPAIAADGTIYVGSWDTYLYAVSPDGTLKWRFDTGDQVNSSPAVSSDGTIYFGSGDDSVYAVGPDGVRKWAYPTGGYVKSSPAIGADGTVYVGSQDCYLYALNPEGNLKWRLRLDYMFNSPAIGGDGTVYVTGSGGALYAVNPNGTLSWTSSAPSDCPSAPVVGSDGTVYFATDNGNLHALASHGSLRWSCPIENNPQMSWYTRSSPTLGPDGTVYVGTEEGHSLQAVQGSGTLADSPWPKFHRDLGNTGRVGQE